MRRDGGGMVKGWCPGTGCPDTKRYKESRYSLKLIGVVGGVGVEVLRHGGNRPLMHGLTRAPKKKQKDCQRFLQEHGMDGIVPNEQMNKVGRRGDGCLWCFGIPRCCSDRERMQLFFRRGAASMAWRGDKQRWSRPVPSILQPRPERPAWPVSCVAVWRVDNQAEKKKNRV